MAPRSRPRGWRRSRRPRCCSRPAARWTSTPSDAVDFETTLAGISAARAGGLRFTIGVDRNSDADTLRARSEQVADHALRQSDASAGQECPDSVEPRAARQVLLVLTLAVEWDVRSAAPLGALDQEALCNCGGRAR
jgi:hypothetical protein